MTNASEISSASNSVVKPAMKNFHSKVQDRRDMGQPDDMNNNNGLMWCRECPKCKQSVGVTFANVRSHISFSDSQPFKSTACSWPSPEWVAHCIVCEEKSQWSTWLFADLEKIDENKLFEEGDVVMSRVKRTGEGRGAEYDLYEFEAKSGTDGLLRWCRNKAPTNEKVGNSLSSCRQMVRRYGLVLHPDDLKHRGLARSKQTLSHEALSNL